MPLNKFDGNYDEHCSNIAYLLRDIYENIGGELRWTLSDAIRAMKNGTATWEEIEELHDKVGEQMHDKLLQQAKVRAQAAIDHYLEAVGANEP